MKEKRFFLSTENLPPHKVFPAWRDALLKAGASGELSTPRPDTFFGSISQYDIDHTVMNFWHTSAVQFKRTTKLSCDQRAQFYSLCYVAEGAVEVTQGRRSSLAVQGDTFLLNVFDPSTLRIPEHIKMSALHIKAGTMKRLVSSPDDVTAVLFTRQSNWGKVLSAMMAATTPEAISQLDGSQHLITEQLGALLSLVAEPTASAKGNYKASLFRRFQSSILEHFQEPDFCPTMLAAEHGVSKRTLYSVFAEEKSSFSTELLSVRMAHARQLLDLPGFARRSIADIARLVGFVHPGHFVTRFRQMYGVTPLAYRNIRRT